MKCIIVDDEPLAREGLKLNIDEVPSLELSGSFENAMQANDFLNDNPVDLMFLDIQMPGVSGLDFLKSLKNRPMVILTTAYPQFALEGFELDVIDYLVKPIKTERFLKAINKARYYYDFNQEDQHEVEDIGEDFIFVKSNRKFVKLHFDDIIYIEGLKDYVIIHVGENKILTAMNVKTIMSQLPQSIFSRINRSYIVNINHIKEVDTDYVKVKDKELTIGNSYKKDFFENVVNKKLIKRP